jgi:hypothetical protein
MDMRRNFFQKTFNDQHNNLALFQVPNVPLMTWFAASLIAKILPEGVFNELAQLIAFGALFTWAWLEIFCGVNFFRRALGVVVLAVTLIIRL